MHDAGTCCPEPLRCQRDRFDLPDDLHYLNGAYMSPLSRTVLAAGTDGLHRKAVPTRIRPADFFTETDAARARYARLVNAPADRIAIIPAVSYGMATVARNLDIGRGQTIVVVEAQFPSKKSVPERAPGTLCWQKIG